MSFRTRTHGTKRQIGKKFPITLMKMKLPPKVTINMVGGKTRPSSNEQKTRYECKECSFKTASKFVFYNHQETTGHEKYRMVIPNSNKIAKLFPPMKDKNCEVIMTGGKVEPFIWYAGKRCKLEHEYETTDEAQAMIDYYRRLGYQAACLHERGKHQLYVEEPKHKGGKIKKIHRNPGKFNYWVRGKSLAWHGGIIWIGPYSSEDEALEHAFANDVIHKRRVGWEPPETE